MFSHTQQVRAVRVTADNELWLLVSDVTPTSIQVLRLIAVLFVGMYVVGLLTLSFLLGFLVVIASFEAHWRMTFEDAKKTLKFASAKFEDYQWIVLPNTVAGSINEPYKLFVNEVLPVLKNKESRITFVFDKEEAQAIETVHRFITAGLCNAENLSYSRETHIMTFKKFPDGLQQGDMHPLVIAHLRTTCRYECDKACLWASAEKEFAVQPDLEVVWNLFDTLLPLQE